MITPILTFSAVLWVHIAHGAYINSFDGPLNFQCPSGNQAINMVNSIHDNGAEDRRFELSCADVGTDTAGDTPDCFWTDYENTYDQLLHYSCPTNHYISGMKSIHNNDAEDRIWKFYCCSVSPVHLVDCEFSGWTNALDKEQAYTLPGGRVMKGVISIHDNGAEDRRYEYEVCNVNINGENLVG